MDHQITLLTDIIVIFGLAVGVVYLFHQLKLPALVGFIVTGIIAGPYGLGLIREPHNVEIYAEVGIVALLFTIGLEFSFRHLFQIRRALLLGGATQVLLTVSAGYFLLRPLGFPPAQAVFIGFLLALSSTAIVLKLLQERAELDTLPGKAALGILIFQDLIIVPMLLVTPLLAGMATGLEVPWGEVLLKGSLIVLILFLGAKYLIPRLLFRVAGTRNKELFVLIIVLVCLAVAWLTYQAGLSLALGAFLAGIIISESEYSHEAMDHIRPFSHLFSSFFFVSIGMLLDVGFLLSRPWLILALSVAVISLKALLVAFTLALQRYPLTIWISVGLGLSQIGEFSFVLSRTGLDYGLLGGDVYQYFLAVTVITMALSPFLVTYAPSVAEIGLRVPLPRWLKHGSISTPCDEDGLKDHLLIIGFGLNGRNVARAARRASIPYVVIESNPETVKIEKDRGEPIYFGDANHETVLKKAGISEARVLVVVINDPVSTRRITELARRLNPGIHTIVRTRYLNELTPLYQAGASEVIPEEFETSVEIFSRVLRKYLIPRTEIESFIAEVRQDNYDMLRKPSAEAVSCRDLNLCLPDLEVSTLRVSALSPLVGKTLQEAALPKNYGITVLAISRDNNLKTNPEAETRLLAGDVVVIITPFHLMSRAAHLFSPGEGDEVPAHLPP